MTNNNDHAPVSATCSNCGALLSARFCAQCGQDSHVKLTVRHFTEELVEGMTHFDSTFWRTFVPLLLKPGFLTQQFFEGKRKYYAPPLRTYLVLSVLYFLLSSFTSTLHTRFVGPGGRELGPQDCAEMASNLKLLSRFAPDIEGSCRRAMADNGHTISGAVVGMMPKVMFVVLPLVALVQFWFYRRQRRLYIENLVFILHFQSFYFLVSSAAVLLALLIVWVFGTTPQAVNGGFDAILYVAAAIYLFIADRRVYGAGKFKAAVSVLALAIAYTVFWVVGVSIAGMYVFFHV